MYLHSEPLWIPDQVGIDILTVGDDVLIVLINLRSRPV